MASNEVELDVVRNADQIFVDYWTQMITNTGKAVTQLYNAGELNSRTLLNSPSSLWASIPAESLPTRRSTALPWALARSIS